MCRIIVCRCLKENQKRDDENKEKTCCFIFGYFPVYTLETPTLKQELLSGNIHKSFLFSFQEQMKI